MNKTQDPKGNNNNGIYRKINTDNQDTQKTRDNLKSRPLILSKNLDRGCWKDIIINNIQ